MNDHALAVTTTELARHFGDYLARVRFGGQMLIVLKNNSPVAELRPLPDATFTLSDFLAVWGDVPADEHFADDLERVGEADSPMENPWD